MLCYNAYEALYAAQHHAVNHNGAVLFAVRANVFKVEPLRHLHIQLYRAALPCASQRIGKVEVQLRAVERAVAFVYNIGLAHVLYRALERFRCHVPCFLFAYVILGHGGNLYLVAESEGGVHLVKQPYNVLYLLLHLVPGHEYVRIILCEAAHAEQPVQRAGKLVPVHKAKLRHPQRQLAVGMRLCLIYQHSAGAVHGLYGVILAVYNGGIHIVLIMVPMPAAQPQIAVKYYRR